MMPPVSLPLNGGTQSARAGAPASIPQTATRHTAPNIRIADSISLGSSIERGGGREKNDGRLDCGFSTGVAALHLTLLGLHGTVQMLD